MTLTAFQKVSDGCSHVISVHGGIRVDIKIAQRSISGVACFVRRAFVWFPLKNYLVLLADFKSAKQQLDKYQLHQLSLVNDTLCRFFETEQLETMERTLVRENLKAYHDYLAKNHREAYAHFVSLIDGTGYKRMLQFINKELPKTYKQIIEFIQSL